ncbi:MAG: DNA-directed RNA polymerase subunit omega [Proteobacteria bacterium]|nr:DNA-directed RNA polymerase subunit omega [Pseudomonadota bacterium]
MARVTVEDCVVRIPNRFELVMLASQRAREIAAGSGLTVDRDNDKNPVIALREIAAESVSLEGLRDNLIQGLRKHVEFDKPEESELDLLVTPEQMMAAEGGLNLDEEVEEDALTVQEEGSEEGGASPEGTGEEEEST